MKRQHYPFAVIIQVVASCAILLLINSMAADSIHAMQESIEDGQVTTEQIENLKQNQETIRTTTIVGSVTTILVLILNMVREDRKGKRDEQTLKIQREADAGERKALRDQDIEDRRLAREEQDRKIADLKKTAEVEAEISRLRAEKVAHELRIEAMMTKRQLQESESRIIDKVETKVNENTLVNVAALNDRVELEKRIAKLTELFMANTVDTAHLEARTMQAEERAARAEETNAAPRSE